MKYRNPEASHLTPEDTGVLWRAIDRGTANSLGSMLKGDKAEFERARLGPLYLPRKQKPRRG